MTGFHERRDVLKQRRPETRCRCLPIPALAQNSGARVCRGRRLLGRDLRGPDAQRSIRESPHLGEGNQTVHRLPVQKRGRCRAARHQEQQFDYKKVAATDHHGVRARQCGVDPQKPPGDAGSGARVAVRPPRAAPGSIGAGRVCPAPRKNWPPSACRTPRKAGRAGPMLAPSARSHARMAAGVYGTGQSVPLPARGLTTREGLKPISPRPRNQNPKIIILDAKMRCSKQRLFQGCR